jgi:ABC-type Fe3+/spermidine/putrescine transport system ATPase subunit
MDGLGGESLMLELRNCAKSFNGKPVLENINIIIKKGSIVSFLGPSGSGKTTLIRIIMGLETPDEGEVSWGGRLLASGKKTIVKPEDRSFSLVYQDFMLFPHLDVYGNINLGLGRAAKHEKEKIVLKLAEALEITHLLHRPIDTLSGGEQQRVSICRALAVRPEIVMFDEPFSNLDRNMKERLWRKLKQLVLEAGITVVFATHDHGEAFFWSDKIYVLREGRVEDGNEPYLLYTKPATPWSASFIGEINYFSGLELVTLFGLDSGQLKNDSYYLVRPEEFTISTDRPLFAKAVIDEVEYYGFYRSVNVQLAVGKKIRIKDFVHTHLAAGLRVSIGIDKAYESLTATETSVCGGIES